MNVLDRNKIGKEVLGSLHYASLEDAGLTMLHLSCMAKVSEYKSDDEHLIKKYKMSFEEFKKQVESKTNEESFEEDDDLLAWQHAHDARIYWEMKAGELNKCY